MTNLTKHLFIFIVVFIGLVSPTLNFGQDAGTNKRNYHAGLPYTLSDLENINLSNGNLIFNFNFNGLPLGRGGLTNGMSLRYNSKTFESHIMSAPNHSNQVVKQQFLRMGEDSWKYSYGLYEVKIQSKWEREEGPFVACGQNFVKPDFTYIHKVKMSFPDGSEHEFRPTGYSDRVPLGSNPSAGTASGYYNVTPKGVVRSLIWARVDSGYTCEVVESEDPKPYMVYYSSDGSNMRLHYYRNESWTLFKPDGSKVVWEPISENSQQFKQKIYDSNGNYIEQSGVLNLPDGSQVEGWVDQLGRFSSGIKRNHLTKEDHIYSQGVNGEILKWIIKWKTITFIRPYQTSGVPTSQNDRGTSSYQTAHESFDVIDKIYLPQQSGGQFYTFTYDAFDGEVDFTPNSPNYSDGWGVLRSITLPSGAKAEYEYQPTKFPLNLSEEGLDQELVEYTQSQEYTDQLAELSGSPILFNTFQLVGAIGKMRIKKLIYNSENDGSNQQITDKWIYPLSGTSGSTTGMRPLGQVTAPDGSVTKQEMFLVGELAGRVYKQTNADGSVTEYLFKENVPGFDFGPQGYGSADKINSFVKTEYTTIVDASGNHKHTLIKDYNQDKNGNITRVAEYDFVNPASIPRDQYTNHPNGIPANIQPLRVTETSYYNPTPNFSDTTTDSLNAYWNSTAPRLTSVKASEQIKNANDQILARTEFFYDDPSNKGNLIEVRVWDSTKGELSGNSQSTNRLNSLNSIITKTEYDQYGNPSLTTDAKGNQTQITYGTITTPSGSVTGLYPTQVVSAYGTAIAQTVQTTYDFYTGLPKTVTTLGNTTAENITSETEYDALGRPIKTKAAVGTPLEIWSTTEYDNVARRVITRSDIETKGDGKKIAIQHFDQLGRVRLARSIENVASENPYNESDGIKVQTRYQTGNPYSYQLTSNPYRAATSTAATNEPSMGWTRSKSVNTGRHSEVETFTGAALPAPWGNNSASTGMVATDIDADRTLVTDQAGKRRISKTNALGQLLNVWEVKEADADTEAVSFTTGAGTLSLNALKTSYQYDILNNLTTVNQGIQTRSFAYSSLSRLITANNPESDVISYAYDENGNLVQKKDARNVKTNYVYDALNRVTDRSYQDESPLQRATLPVKYIYDSNNIANSKGKLTKVITGTVNSPFAVTEYQEFDLMGRVKKSQQTTDGTAYNPMEYTYNLSGALIEQKYPSGRVVKNTLDNEGDLALVQSRRDQNAGLVAYAKHFTYTAAGAVSSMQLGNGAWESTVFNSRLQPTQIALGSVKNGTNKLKLDFTYNTTTNGNPNADNNGNVLSQTITTPSETRGSTTYSAFTAIQTYQYDSLNRIKEAEEKIGTTQQWKQTFVYDRYGNRTFDEGSVSGQYKTTTLPRNCGTSPNLVCAKDNPQAIAANNKLQGIEYDSAGNTRTDLDNRRFTYDGENKQIKVETTDENGDPVATLGEYFYDGDGKRVKKVSLENSQWITTIFVYDASGKMVAEYSTQTSTTPEVSYLTNDHLGSPRVNTDAVGNVTARHDYQPFGEEIQRASHGTDQVRKKFTGYERDIETDLDFAKARMYESKLGRFLVSDPMLSSGEIQNPQTWNRYIYTLNNPINSIDPLGLWSWGKSLGGSLTDDQLRQYAEYGGDLQIWAEDVLAARQEIIAAINDARAQAEDKNSNLNANQRKELKRSLASYGKDERDANGVIIESNYNETKAGRTSPTLSVNDKGKYSASAVVTFKAGITGLQLAGQIVHEGTHVADIYDFAEEANRIGLPKAMAGNLNPTLLDQERRAYSAQAYIFKVNGKTFGFSVKSVIWRKGLEDVDKTVLEAYIGTLKTPDQLKEPLVPNNFVPTKK